MIAGMIINKSFRSFTLDQQKSYPGKKAVSSEPWQTHTPLGEEDA